LLGKWSGFHAQRESDMAVLVATVYYSTMN
jgi:hypothetical protein